MNNDKIQNLKNEINSELGVKKYDDFGFKEDPSKIKKLKKKIKKKLKVVDTEPKESEV